MQVSEQDLLSFAKDGPDYNSNGVIYDGKHELIVCTHDECRNFGKFRSTRIGNNLQCQCMSASLNTFVDKNQ